MSPTHAAKPHADEFYIGWLPTPSGYLGFLILVVCIMAGCVAIAAVVLASIQKSPGTGQWEDGQVIEISGLAVAAPYAMLQVFGDERYREPRTFVLVEDGKFGALPRVSRLLKENPSGALVQARGTVLHRDDRWMLSLEIGEASLRFLDSQEASKIEELPSPVPKLIADSLTLRGEIIDPKCYLGAMKPGGGKTHKACAMRCISGGIPPMLVTRSKDQHEDYFLLVAEDGGIANELVFPFIGDQVELTGRLEMHHGLSKFFVDRESIRRL